MKTSGVLVPKPHSFLCFLFIFFVNVSIAQIKIQGSEELLSILNSNKNETQIEIAVDSLLDSYIRPKQDSLLAAEIHEYGKWWYKRNINKAINYTKKAVTIRKQSIPYNLDLHALSLNNLAIFYHRKGDVINSIKYHTKYINITEDQTRKNAALYRLGLNYWEIKDFYNALLIYQQLEKLSIQLNDTKKLLAGYIQSAKVHFNIYDQENYKKGIAKALKADSIMNTLDNVSNHDRFQTYSILASLYKKKGNDTLNALKYYRKIIQSGKEKGEHHWVGRAYIDLQGLMQNEVIDTSLFYLNTALKYIDNDHILKATISQNKSWAYYKDGNTKKALENSSEAIQHLVTNASGNNLPTYHDLQISASKILLLEILKDNVKYTQKHFEETKDLPLLKNSLNISILADQLVDIIRLESSEQQAHLFWKKDASDLYMDAVKTSVLLNQPEKALYFLEKSKALLLLEDISNEQLRRVNAIPDHILEREFLLKRKIATIQNKLGNPSENDSIQLKLFNAKHKYSAFVDSLQLNYPQYYNSKRTANIVSLKETQEYAAENNASFIHYILDQEQGYGLVINKNTTKLFQLKNIKDLQKDIKAFNKLISQPLHSRDEFITYNKVSKRLYNTLIPEEIRPSLTEKITLISDHNIYNIPFEALINENNQYLIEEYEMNYAYSISFLLQNKKTHRVAQKDFLGFGPVQYSYDLPTLKNTETEIDQIASQFNNHTILLNKQASKENLMDELSTHKIIHLSTHAEANDSITPWIAGVHEKITLNDIYSTKNNAELVVLSACKTSVGTIEKGEGVMSLTRGFFNTGANSVISTLWKADDKSTLELTTNFYKYLEKGKSKSEALRMAKLDYIKNHSIRKASPYYWSLLILVGDPAPIKSSVNIWIFIFGFIIIALLILTIYKKLKTKP